METTHKTLLALERRPKHRAPAYKPNRVFETMTCVNVGTWTVRVWREEPTFMDMMLKLRGDQEVATMIRQHSMSAASIVMNVGLLDRVAAIELLDAETKCGALFYPDWR